MSDWYVLRQLRYDRNGLRGESPDDIYGMQMVPIMTMFEEADLVDLVA